MRKLEVKIKQIIWSLKQSFKPSTYDTVIYQGNKYFIKSSLTGENIWNLFEKGEKKPKHYRISGDELKIAYSLKRFINSFKKHLLFQRQNWGLIDCKNPIGTRLSYLSSENIYFHKCY